MTESSDRLKLYGFNNLTKTLSFNIYDVCYAETRKHQKEYIEYIDEAYSGERLTQILTNVSEIIGARILNTATQSYEPQGASVTMMISEDAVDEGVPAPLPNAVVSHLDKSHLTVHTYPESHPENGVTTFRADIDVATCGRVSPLNALNYLIDSFDEDIVIMDYRVRGFTRDVKGDKHFIDNKVNSIQEFLSVETTERYQTIDMNVYHENIFHTKMMLRDFTLNDYLFGRGEIEFEPDELERIERQLKWEMAEIFYGRNL